MVASIRERGVLVPVIVRPLKINYIPVIGRYEILSGHNRVNAAKIAELTTVPAEIRDVDDAQAVIIVNETNLQQRSFKDWRESEKARSIAQYHDSIKNQGKRQNTQTDTSAESQQSSDSYARRKTALIYGVKENIIEKYLQLNRLIEPLKNRLDGKDSSFGSIAAKHISLLTKKYKFTVNKAKKIRDRELTAESVEAILQEESNPAAKSYTVKSNIISKYFPGVKEEELESELIEALRFYREHTKVIQ